MNLKHTYYLIRHGQSKANEQKIIVSDIRNGIKSKFGLTSKGQEQCVLSAELFAKQFDNFTKLLENFIFVVSPFSRTVETANVFMKQWRLHNSSLFIDNNLRERYYGVYELGLATNYKIVWQGDFKSLEWQDKNVETVNQVTQRMLKVLEKCEKDFEPKKTIFLVGHEDPLVILESYIRGFVFNIADNRLHMRNADIRVLNK
jgi:broad specificity phosphatase PhoE